MHSYGSEVFLAVNGTFAGYMVISDTIKSDAVSAIRSIEKHSACIPLC